ncbi:hypothetical protein [Rhodococcus wratislaviensis]|uniref:hypothetical protein n=1 Tax=Rhodococcus wratislaviensis TaxID=44752 RepID=UPI000F5602BA|nr:hypothetical protein [Rhodococcus wratislaviensis]
MSTMIERAQTDPDAIMLVGAHCRDLLHIAHGHHMPLRSTNDIDIAVVVSEWEYYQRLTGHFNKTDGSDVRFLIDEIPVDIVPFGAIEDPAGSAAIPHRGDAVDVFAFREVFYRAPKLVLPSGVSIKLPTPQGYAALKLKAWCDRSAAPRYEYKDASDLAVVCFWYRNSEVVLEYLYSEGSELLVSADYSPDRATLLLLGRQIVDEIGNARTGELREKWLATDVDRFVEYFYRAPIGIAPVNLRAAGEAVRDLTAFLHD